MLAFGPFLYDPQTRLLHRDGVVVPLARRTLEFLDILAARPGELVSHRDLIETVWPARGGDAAGLRVHMSALRRSLSDDDGHYIINEHGRGYRLLAVSTTAASPPPAASPDQLARNRPPSLPVNLGRIIGRDTEIGSLLAGLSTHRLHTIVGPGGIGKTTLAVEVAARFAADFDGEVIFVDLSVLSDGEAVAAFVGAALGLVGPDAATPGGLALAIGGRTPLLVLDNCEHIVAAVAELVEALVTETAGLRVLATSREVLGVAREHVYRLPGMELPPADGSLSADDTSDYPAVELLAERVAATAEVAFSGQDMPMVAELCRRLDGIPLALELAAGWIGVIGLSAVIRGLDGRFIELSQGRRAAAPRHRTLLATLDWSFALLPAPEQNLLLSLSVFRGPFSLEAAVAAVGNDEVLPRDLPHRLGQLVAKSLLISLPADDGTTYRLLEITRSYASRRLATAAYRDAVYRRHARHVAGMLAHMEADRLVLPRVELSRRYRPLLADVRAALDWAFGPAGDDALAVDITGGAIPMGLQYWQPGEFAGKLDQALRIAMRLGPDARRQTIRLSYQIGHILNQVAGDTERLRATMALVGRATGNAADVYPEELMAEWVAAFTLGNYRESLLPAERLSGLSAQMGDEVIGLLADRIMAQSLHFLGQHHRATGLAQRVLDCHFEHLPYSQIGHRVSMRIVLARIAFIEGDDEQATLIAAAGLAQAQALNPISLCQMLALCTLPLALWQNRRDDAADQLELLGRTAAANGLGYWQDWAANLARAIATLDLPMSADWLENEAVSPKFVDFAATLGPHFCSDRAWFRWQNGQPGWSAPEILRGRAQQIAGTQPHRARELLVEARDLAQQQGARAWEARATAALVAIP